MRREEERRVRCETFPAERRAGITKRSSGSVQPPRQADKRAGLNTVCSGAATADQIYCTVSPAISRVESHTTGAKAVRPRPTPRYPGPATAAFLILLSASVAQSGLHPPAGSHLLPRLNYLVSHRKQEA